MTVPLSKCFFATLGDDLSDLRWKGEAQAAICLCLIFRDQEIDTFRFIAETWLVCGGHEWEAQEDQRR